MADRDEFLKLGERLIREKQLSKLSYKLLRIMRGRCLKKHHHRKYMVTRERFLQYGNELLSNSI
jgi:hypothetical protein